MNCPFLSTLTYLVLLGLCKVTLAHEVVWAVNCGGSAHKDVNGIEYMEDTLATGIASTYGLSFYINRVPTEDQLIYQTERYNTDDFSYEIPIVDDGNYVLTLKFSEVWFTSPGEKVFDVKLNNEVSLIEDLDVFSEVGFATALDYHIPLEKLHGTIRSKEGTVDATRNYFTVNFIKSARDNPKVNAIILTKGSVDDVPKLAPLEKPKVTHVVTPQSDKTQTSRRRPSGKPKTPDPYATIDYSTWLLPALVCVVAFIPVLFCLCKL